MKKIKKISSSRKGLLIVGLSSCLGLSACGSYIPSEYNIESQSDVAETNEVNVSEENTQEADNRIYYTDDYYVVYLNDHMYITIREDNKYYDVITGEFVGEVLSKHNINREVIYSDTLITRCEHKASLCDDKYYNGEYGYGNIIPTFSCFPLRDVYDKEALNKEEFEFVTSNSDELKEYIKSKLCYNDYHMIVGFTSKTWPLGTVWENIYGDIPLSKYICKKENGESEIFVGYLCSDYDGDIGNDLVYDVLTGTIHYIGTKRPDSYVEVNVKTIDNSKGKSVEEMIESCSSDKKEKLEEKDNKFYKENMLYILDSKSDFVDFGTSNKHYHLLTLNEATMSQDNNIYDTFVFQEINNSNAVVVATVIDETFYLTYSDSEKEALLSLSGENNSNILVDINSFLISNNYSSLVKENGQYSDDEINEIYQCIDELNHQTVYKKK